MATQETQDPGTDLVVNAGVNIPSRRFHPEETSDSKFLGVGGDDLTQAVVGALARLQFQWRNLRQWSRGSVHLYPGQRTLSLQLDLRDGFEGRQRALGQRQRQLLFRIPLDEL